MNSIYESTPVLKVNESPPLIGLSYPSCRPMKGYRKTGATSVSSIKDCTGCKKKIIIGKPYKLLGKKETGELKSPCCNLPTFPHGNGNVISFSGRSAIRSSLNNTNVLYPDAKAYFSNYASYLKGRGNTYLDKSKFNVTNPIDTSFCETNPETTECNTCFRTVYKPNNSTFKTQGGVSSNTYTDRQKYNTITKSNNSFQVNYGVKLNYQESPVFFIKNKINKCMCIV